MRLAAPLLFHKNVRAHCLFKDFDELALTEDERNWLPKGCPYFTQDYINYLAQYRFKPDQVKVTFHEKAGDSNLGRVGIEATGPWRETILWEVPLMATLSEIYFSTVDTDWSYDGQEGTYHDTATYCTIYRSISHRTGPRERQNVSKRRMPLQRVRHATAAVVPHAGHRNQRAGKSQQGLSKHREANGNE